MKLKVLIVLSSYFAFSLVGGIFFYSFIKEVGGVDRLPTVLIVFFGPIVALGQGEVLLIYLVATLVAVPCLILAVRAPRFWVSKSLWAAIVVWLAIGVWML
jgi:hypothetical protein